MRGKESNRLHIVSIVGITPAHAGKSRFGSARHLCPWDHPRACGEKPLQKTSICRFFGSPPRMRGKGFCGIRFCVEQGITPAYAGKSQS